MGSRALTDVLPGVTCDRPGMRDDGTRAFESTMKGLEAGLTVGDIAAYGLASCDVEDDAAGVFARADLRAYDCIPVRREGNVVGVLLRAGRGGKTGRAGDAMRPLDESLLVSSSQPLKELIPLLAEQPQRLVVRGARVDGIVTRSDLHKLPVRVLVFALVTHLELTMAQAIGRAYEGDAWLEALTPSRRARVLEKHDALRSTSFEPPLLELTDFCDKREALSKAGLLAVPSKSRAVEDFERIEELRNSVAHAATYAGSDEQLRELVELLGLAEEWIGRLAATG